MAVETHVHDGSAWRKAKELHVHDGTAWRDCKQAWCHDGSTWRKVFQKSKWLNTGFDAGSGHYVRSVAKGGGVIYVGTSDGKVWEKNGATWTSTTFGAAAYVCASSTTVFASTADGYVYYKAHGGSWSGGMYIASSGPMILKNASTVYLAGNIVYEVEPSVPTYAQLDDYNSWFYPSFYYTRWNASGHQLTMHGGNVMGAMQFYDSSSPAYLTRIAQRNPNWSDYSTQLAPSSSGWESVISDGTNIIASQAGYPSYLMGATTAAAIPWADTSAAFVGYTYGELFAKCASTIVACSLQATAYPYSYVPAKYVSGSWEAIDQPIPTYSYWSAELLGCKYDESTLLAFTEREVFAYDGEP